ncbi:MAG TPA: redoxin domain-containing protein [Puia sp.]|nr:redoxin domain-containing protein [Puia sp.]
MSLVKKIAAGLLLLVITASLRAQVTPDSAQLKNVKGVTVSFSSLSQKAPLTLVCFWSMNSETSINELNAISAQYEKWKQAAVFTMLAVSVDEGVTPARLRGIANMNTWAFEVFSDFRGDLHQALNVGNLPQAMVLQGGQVVYQQSGFGAGSEHWLISKIQALSPAPGTHKK